MRLQLRALVGDVDAHAVLIFRPEIQARIKSRKLPQEVCHLGQHGDCGRARRCGLRVAIGEVGGVPEASKNPIPDSPASGRWRMTTAGVDGCP